MKETKTIEECFYHIQNGANIKQGVLGGGYPITRIETISNDKFNRDKMGYAGIENLKSYASYVLEDGDLLMSHINSVQYLGRTVLYKRQGDEIIIHGMNLLRLKANGTLINPIYARYYFSSRTFREQVRKITKKSVNQASFSVSDLKKIKVILPDLTKQKEIAIMLENVNDLLFLHKKQIQQFDDLIKSRFVEMFGDEKTFDLWPCCTVEDVSEVCVGVVIKPTQYYTEKESGIPAFRSLNIGCMNVKDNEWVYFTEEGHAKNQKSVIRENDVLVVRSGTPGTACVVSSKFAGHNAVDIIIAHPDEEKVNSVFLAMFTNMPHGMNQIRKRTGGAAQQHFNVGGYKALKLIMPPLRLQNEFAAFVRQVDKLKFETQKSLKETQTLMDSLMQEYFG